jgi:hypothetical protein
LRLPFGPNLIGTLRATMVGRRTRDRLWTTVSHVEDRMAKASLTIQLDQAIIRRARIVAAKRGTSLSALVARELDQLVARDDRYEDARRRAVELMETARPHGGRAWTREDIYAERLDRFEG